MMREILFRGKQTDNGEFVQGDLIQLHDGRKFIINNKHGACIDDKGNFINTEAPFVCEVIPETVGQYTGITDKNGKKVFEGDIVRYKKNPPCKIEYINCQFVMMWEKFYRDFEDVYDHDMEVVGNIHDNPGLLGGADNGKV